MPKILHYNYGGAGKVFDGPGYVYKILVVGDGNGNGIADFKTASGGSTYFTVRILDHSSQFIDFGEHPFAVEKGDEFYQGVTNCNIAVWYED